MLILADADRLRLDLDELGQRVLEPPGDRDRAAQRDVEVGELLRGELGGGIDRGARLRDDHLGRLRRRQGGEHLGDQLLGLAAGGAVADGDELDAVAADQRGERGLCAADVVLRLERIDGVGREQLAGRVDDRDLDAGAHARVEAHGRARAGGRGQQQVAEVAGEDADGLVLSALAQLAEEVEHHRQAQPSAPGPAGDVREPSVAGSTAAGDAERGRDHRLDLRQPGLRVRADVEGQNAFVGAAHHCQRPVARRLRPALAVGEVVGELGALLLLALDDLGGQKRALLQERAQPAEQRGVLGEALGQDVAGAGERLLRVRHLVGHVGRGQRLGRRPAVGEDRLGQRPQPLLPRDGGAGAALGLVRQIEVLERRLAGCRGDARLELGRELLLLADRAEDRRPPGLELAQVGEPVGEATQLGIVEPAGRLLAVARDEGNRGAPHRGAPRRRRPGRAARRFRTRWSGRCAGRRLP